MPISVIPISDDQVKSLLELEEGHFLDLKAVEISPASVTKAVSAFANTSGGELFIGIDEHIGKNGKERAWRGFSDQEAANGLIQALEAMSPLGNHYTVEFLQNEKTLGLVAHITTFKARDILVASNGTIYVRRGAQKLPIQGDEALERLKYDKGVNSFEDELSDLSAEELANSLKIIDFLLKVVPSAEPLVWLEKQRLLSKGRATVAGVLLFGDEPQAILPKRSAVKVFRYKTKGEGERDTLVTDPITVEGPVYELIYESVERTKGIVEGVQKVGVSGMEAVSYPQEALHEIITNAVLHRDYSIAADVQVRVFDNRIEIESPGKFPGHITEKNILSEQFARNPKLVRLINKFPDAPNKDVGEGLNTAFEAMNKLRLKEPIISERENAVMIVLRHESLGSPEQLVIEYVQTHEEITNALGRDLTGIKSENTMKEVFYRLRDRNLLEQVPEKLGNKAAWRKRAV
jgi:ATP-dependent DNA helicase RecG